MKSIILLITIFGLLSVHQASFANNFLRSSESLSGLALLQASASSTNKVTIQKTGNIYTALVDFKKKDSKSYPMQLAFYTGTTIFADKGCLNFTTYSCEEQPNCKKVEGKFVNKQFVNFDVSSSPAIQTDLFMNYDLWTLSEYTPVGHASTCNSKSTNIGLGSYGMIGMALDDRAYNNYYGDVANFSLSYSSETKNFEMEFNPLLDFPKTKVFSSKVSKSLAPVTTFYSMKLTKGDTTTSPSISQITAIFDLNFKGIGIPSNTYSYLKSALTDYFKVDCDSPNSNGDATCFVSGAFKMEDLPVITFKADNYNPLQWINITPAMYALNPKSSGSYLRTFTLGFTSTSKSNEGPGYVSADYSSQLILGDSFLAIHHTLFNIFDESVTLYQKNATATATETKTQ